MAGPLFLGVDDRVLEEILFHLHPKDVFTFSLTCKNIRERLKKTALGSFVCEYVNARFITRFSEVVHGAYMSNDPNVLDWMYHHEQEFMLDGHFCSTAAAYDCRKSIAWYTSKGKILDARACNEAARRGRLQTLIWLRREGWPWDETTGEAAVDGRHEKTLEYLIDYPEVFDATACQTAAEKGDLKTLVWLRDHNVNWDGNTVYEAARLKKSTIVSWAKKNGCPLDRYVAAGIRESVLDDDVETLGILHKYGYCVDQVTQLCSTAAMYNSMKVLTWANREGFSWDATTCAHAAENGNLEMLRWLHEKGCPWDFRVIIRAANAGHQHILSWIDSV